MTAELMTPEQEIQQAQAEALKVLTSAKAIIVTSEDDYRQAGLSFATLKGMLKALEARRVAITGPINQSLKLINDGFKRPKETLEQALGFYETPMLAFKREEERLRRVAEEVVRVEREKLEAEARASARAEDERLQKARREALEAEQKAAELADGDDPFLAAIADEEALEMRRREASAKAAAEEAVRLTMRVEALPLPVPPPVTAPGTSFRRNWKWEVTDESLIPRQYLIPNETLIGGHARTEKENASIPGIRFYCDERIGG